MTTEATTLSAHIRERGARYKTFTKLKSLLRLCYFIEHCEKGPEKGTMRARNYLKKAVSWPAVFLCIFYIGSASLTLGYQPADAIHSGDADIISLDTKDFPREPLFSLSAASPEKIGCFTPAQALRTAHSKASGKVTASWYGTGHHNKLTASGQNFNMYKNTLAHRTLPLGTRVRLVNPDNGKSAEGVVNDRGPYIKGRDVDISYAMAEKLGFVRKGVVKLDMETI